ncbi:MAG: Preflagellin peptidase [Candidatus Methanofastidiosum methylothiophilum]|uniref:Preflagellin peptidase n=1 Tax=Candidatus Methanofastidiosum methylothiophilum TaxID=1705564 RepID=A0A150IRW0_9EURY|nr:MAG: Preflagellin peptidase [Candidatus Methanofastidiosum methylthiophilus]KYC47404.1 MAG: Preflagellin peptidase [Candidatus Methanofastidiosum methylthiophilus]KYC49588.1 MAG: Preflagellin peptidase [Candidatus Methanofastidiosum methylthiophilus]
MDLLIILKIVFGGIVLFHASYLDIKKREIEEWHWIILAILGFIHAIYLSFAFQSFRPLLITGAVFLLMFGLALLLFYLGLFGGGDGKILMGIGALLPSLPGKEYAFGLFPMSVFDNALIISIFLPIFILIYNLSRKDSPKEYDSGKIKKILAMLVGYRLETEKLSEKFYPLEEFKEGKRRIKLFIGDLDFDINKYKKELKDKGIETLWATPGLPFIVPITFGYFIAIFFGDIMLKLVMIFI